MFGPAAAYVVALAAMLFSAASGLTLIYWVGHFDPPEVRASAAQAAETAAV